VPYLSASAVVIHYEEALYQVYAPLPYLYAPFNSSLKWDNHIDYITKRTAKRLWFLKKLKRAGLLADDLVH